MTIAETKFSFVLFALAQVLRHTARNYPVFADRLKERNLVAQVNARDGGDRALVSSSATARSSRAAAGIRART